VKLRRRHLWLLLPVVLGGGVLAVYWAVNEYTRDLPNYTEVEPDLYVGGRVPSPPRRTAAVLNLYESDDPYRAGVHEWHPIPDAGSPGLDWLRGRVRFVEEQRAAGRVVYVHCLNGVSRSGMVATAYLMKRDGLTRDNALARLRVKRPHLRPNPAFMLLLSEYERELAADRG
jgi:protein-tyrosine phosphatase